MGRVAVVTGASRGIGHGVAAELASQGWDVFATGRSIAGARLPHEVRRLTCDHTDDAMVARTFEQILETAGRVDVLVNSVWGGYDRMVVDGRFTWGDPFWFQPMWRWDSMMDAGVRAAFVASQHAAAAMVAAGSGLIVHLSHWAARKRIGNAIYGIAKAATDKMSADMAEELERHNVVVVSLYPGLVRTEAVLAANVFDLSNSEGPEFVGRAVAALANDPEAMRHSGKVLVTAAVALEYGFRDIDQKQPIPLTIDDV